MLVRKRCVFGVVRKILVWAVLRRIEPALACSPERGRVRGVCTECGCGPHPSWVEAEGRALIKVRDRLIAQRLICGLHFVFHWHAVVISN